MEKAWTESDVAAWLESEYNKPFEGWDFSYLKHRRVARGHLPWDYEATASEYLRNATTLLDIDTGGGEILARLLTAQGFQGKAFALEGHAPNINKAKEKLNPLNVEVIGTSARPAGLGASSFDLILNRHGGSISPAEIARSLKPGGFFVTQQVGENTNRELREIFRSEDATPANWPGNLTAAKKVFQDLDLNLIKQQEHTYYYRFMDAGAVVYYLKAIPWEVPGFSPPDHMETLLELHRQAEKRGFAIDASFHTYLLVARKR